MPKPLTPEEQKTLESIQKVIDVTKPPLLARALFVAISYDKIKGVKRSDK